MGGGFLGFLAPSILMFSSRTCSAKGTPGANRTNTKNDRFCNGGVSQKGPCIEQVSGPVLKPLAGRGEKEEEDRHSEDESEGKESRDMEDKENNAAKQTYIYIYIYKKERETERESER